MWFIPKYIGAVVVCGGFFFFFLGVLDGLKSTELEIPTPTLCYGCRNIQPW